MDNSIAIIGMSGLFPDAPGIDLFYKHLMEGKDGVRPLSVGRRIATSLAAEYPYKEMGYLEDIDKFDYNFFNISKREARNMSPQQRLLLEVVYHAVENAGYNADVLRGTRTAVFAASSSQDYIHLASEPDPTLKIGNLHAMIAGRLSRYFDFRGASLMIDTACSSSLVAVHYACRELQRGEADYAVACGIKLHVFPPSAETADDLGILSGDGRTRSYSSEASGTGSGEAAGCVILKPLSRALQDGDIIHAVIKGSAINQDAGLSSTLTAPDSRAQSAVIQAAWKQAGIDPADLGYIEGQGIGTSIGDPIEVKGLDLSFSLFTDKKGFCALSSVKSNVGHTDSAAGITALIKAVLAVRHGQLFGTVHFRQPNPLIDFSSSALYVTGATRSWEVVEGKKRLAGVSAFGISGTNCHLVLEQAPDGHLKEVAPTVGADPYLFTFSARTLPGLTSLLSSMLTDVSERAEVSLPDLSYTLNCGRKHYGCRYSFTASTVEELQHHLRTSSTALQTERVRKPIFVFTAGAVRDGGQLSYYCRTSAVFKEAYERCMSHWTATRAAILQESFSYQYAFYQYLQSEGVSMKYMLGDGFGKQLISVIRGEQSLSAGLHAAIGYSGDETDMPERVGKFIIREGGAAGLLFLSFVPGSVLSDLLIDQGALINIGAAVSLPEIWSQLYQSGMDLDFKQFSGNRYGRRQELPGYPFRKERCWLQEPTVMGVGDRVATTERVAAAVSKQAPAMNGSGSYQMNDQRSIEDRLLEMWTAVLESDEIGGDADFFDLGGHSLNGHQLITRITHGFGVELGFKELFDYCTINKQAAFIHSRASSRIHHGEKLQRLNKQEYYEVSYAQQRLWVLHQFENSQTAYNLPGAFEIKGDLDTEVLIAAYKSVVGRHEILRSTFGEENDLLVQRVQEGASIVYGIERHDISGHAPAAQEEQLVALYRQEQDHVFDLGAGPLIRIGIIRLSEQHQLFLFNLHHIICDGWSINIFFRELLHYYESLSRHEVAPLPALPVQYRDYAAWQRQQLKGDVLQKHRDYWQHIFGKQIPVLQMPSDFSRPPIKTYHGDRVNFVLSKELATAMRTISREEDGTLFMFLLTITNLLIHKYTGQSEFVIGTPSGRREHPDLENQMGLYINTLPLYNNIVAGDRIADLFSRVRHHVLAAIEHQVYPFDLLVEELDLPRDPGRNPLFDIMIIFQNSSTDIQHATQCRGLDITPWGTPKQSTKFDLTFIFNEAGDELYASIEYNTDIYSGDRIKRMAGYFQQIAAQAVVDMTAKITQIDYLPEAEKELLINGFNDTGTVLFPPRTFLECFAEQVALKPDHAAIRFNGKNYSYREVDEQATRLAHLLIDQYKITPESRVGVMQGRSELSIISLLAIFKAGGVYVPIDPSLPPERINYILHDAEVKAMLDGRISFSDVTSPLPLPLLSQSAYIIYTSGSTGQPKGVIITHGALANFLYSMSLRPGVTGADKMLALTTFSFDISLLELLLPLMHGGTVLMAGDYTQKDPYRLQELIDREHPTMIQGTPTMWRLLLEAGFEGYDHLKILSGGERLDATLGQKLLNCVGEVWNMYGPTETTIWSAIEKVTDVSHTATIGKPIHHTQIYILNEAFYPQPVGCSGEIFIGGKGVANGYHGKPTLTAEKFIDNPFRLGEKMYRTGDLGCWTADGKIQFLGRADDQIKISGYRIEPGEIESVMGKYTGIQVGAVIVKEDTEGNAQLIAYVVPADGYDSTALMARLKEQLPHYMVPSRIIVLAALPLTPNGKINRKELPTISTPTAEIISFEGPRNETEERLTSLWCSIMELQQIGIHDDFFALGGNSLQAIRLAATIRKEMQIELTVNTLFQHSSVAMLAQAIQLLLSNKMANTIED